MKYFSGMPTFLLRTFSDSASWGHAGIPVKHTRTANIAGLTCDKGEDHSGQNAHADSNGAIQMKAHLVNFFQDPEKTSTIITKLCT
jgi:hypothetical protein